MKSSFKIFILFSMIAVLISFCSEDKNPLPSVSHPEGWNTVSAENFHGPKVLDTGYNSCKSCHGNELKGGKTKESCFDCHQTYPHADEWSQVGVSNTHAAYIKVNNNSTGYCKSCHGDNLQGGRSGVSCYDCHKANSLP